MNAYGQNSSTNLVANIARNPRDGLFAPSRFIHCGFLFDRPKINGTNVVDALFLWMTRYFPGGSFSVGEDYKWIDPPCGENGDSYFPVCNHECPIVPA